MAKNAKTDHLKGKTDAECRELMVHYYLRAKKAERSAWEANERANRLNIEVIRLGSIVGESKALAAEIASL